MAKYEVKKLKINNGVIVDYNNLNNDWKTALSTQNIIYIYRSSITKKVYIGQTVCFVNRNSQHYDGTEQKFLDARFDGVFVVVSRYFNGSALDDVESQLITYFIADNQKVINLNGGNSVNEYSDREKVASEVIIPLWENELSRNGWVNTSTLDVLRTKELVKYSPIKTLTTQQNTIIGNIIQNTSDSYVINGDAGTGKTVLLTNLVAKLLKERPNATIGVVVQSNWMKTCKKIFKVYGMNNSALYVGTSTQLICKAHESGQRFDVIIVDESHKLSRNYGKQQPSFFKVYKYPEFSNCESHLEILQKLGAQLVLMYDVLQAIRPANVTRAMFARLTRNYKKEFLKTQFRIQAPAGKTYTSDDYINGIKYLLYKDTGLLNTTLTNFDPDFNRDVFRDVSDDAYFGYFKENPLHNLVDWKEEDNNFHPEHINRILGGLVEDWKQSDGLDPNITHWHEGDLNLRWNSTQENWIHIQDDDAEDQIGSVFAVQGIDLNKVGVLIGKDLEVVNGKLVGNPNNFYNVNGKFTNEEMEVASNKFEFTLFVLNIYYVLMTRGIDGIRLGFWHNDDFRKYMEDTLEINQR